MRYLIIFKPVPSIELMTVVDGVSSEKQALVTAINASQKCFKEENAYKVTEETKHKIVRVTKENIGAFSSGTYTGTATCYLTNGQVYPYTFEQLKGILTIYKSASKEIGEKRIRVLFYKKQNSKSNKQKTSTKMWAKVVLSSKYLLKETLVKFEARVKKDIPQSDACFDIARTLYNMGYDYWKGNYTEIPTGTILAIIAVIIYVGSPIDFIPDCFVGIGQIDDLAVLRWALNNIGDDIQAYKKWKQNQPKEREKVV